MPHLSWAITPLLKHYHFQRLVTATFARNLKRHDHAVAVRRARVGTAVDGRLIAVVEIAV